MPALAFFLLHQRFVVLQSGRVVQQIADADRFAAARKFRKDLGEIFVVPELAIVHQQHCRHRSKLFCARSQPEVCLGVDGRQRPQIAHSVAALENGAPILADQHCKARGFCIGQGRENRFQFRYDLVFARSGVNRMKTQRRKKQPCACTEVADPQYACPAASQHIIPLLHAHAHPSHPNTRVLHACSGKKPHAAFARRFPIPYSSVRNTVTLFLCVPIANRTWLITQQSRNTRAPQSRNYEALYAR